MKRSFLAICSLFLLVGGCKEIDTPLTTGSPFVDTTYVSSVPQADAHSVLAEEFTGQSCPNCPAGHADLDGQAKAYPGHVNIVSLYFYGGPQTVPDNGSKYDLRDSAAYDISTSIYGGINGLPSAGIDRVAQSGSMVLYESGWNSAITAQESTKDSVNLSVSSSYVTNVTGADTVTTATIEAAITYLQPTTGLQNISIVLVEDSMISLQEDNTAANGIDSFYVFTNVFRGIVTKVTGDQILPTYTSKEAGRVDQIIYTYKLPNKHPAIIPAHCRIVAFVTEESGSPVLQSAQCPL